MHEIIIEIKNLTKVYENKAVVDNLNLNIAKGEVFGLLGPNGAGKTTTILMMLGLTEPTSGEVKISGIDATRNPVNIKKIVGYLPEDVGFYDQLTGVENLVYTAQLNGLSRTDAYQKAEILLQKVGLSEDGNKKTSKYSRGMRQRLGLADVLIKNPQIIILDEPTLGIDPSGMIEFLNLIISLSKHEGITVIFSSHHLHQVQQICDRVGIFVDGKLIAEGNIESLSKQIFGENTHHIEFAITTNTVNIDQLQTIFNQIEGIKKINNPSKNTFIIDSTRDITMLIAQALIENKLNFSYIKRKEYGLDDIYNKYFLGGEVNE